MTAAQDELDDNRTDRTSEIRRLCQVLADLLDDPHPGLSTWVETRQRAAEQLQGLLSVVLSEPGHGRTGN